MNVLIIASVWPEPASSGAGLRMKEMIQLFAGQGWRVTVASTAADSEHMEDLNAQGVERQSIQVNHSSFDRFIGKLKPDLVLFERFSMEEQFGWRVEKACPDAMRVIETIDLHCLRAARELAFKRAPAVIREVGTAELYNDIALREIAAIHRSDLSIMVSDYEMALLEKQFSVSRNKIHLCPFMFAEHEIDAHAAGFSARKHFVSIGNFRHAPNWDAVLWLKREIWPRIRLQLPDAELHIYGAYTPAKATALHKPGDGFFICDRADDVNEVMQQARVCLAPLRFGAGIKTKLADAMRNGTPSVTTSVGMEAMSSGLPWCGSVADDAGAVAEAAVALYRNPQAWQQAQKNGFEIAGHLFNAKINGEALIQSLQNMQANLAEYRQQDFIGRMLRSHHMRSTEFMSRWIEAKQQLVQESTPKG